MFAAEQCEAAASEISDAGHRKAHRWGNPTSFSARQAHRRRM